mmetsp:Transcript_41669/g.61021  ORF Transcript_41669/g.61021 Transcript_41669/m.61021 type:complete len:88 (-) Transcript_41669:986-1249(-)
MFHTATLLMFVCLVTCLPFAPEQKHTLYPREEEKYFKRVYNDSLSLFWFLHWGSSLEKVRKAFFFGIVCPLMISTKISLDPIHPFLL